MELCRYSSWEMLLSESSQPVRNACIIKSLTEILVSIFIPSFLFVSADQYTAAAVTNQRFLCEFLSEPIFSPLLRGAPRHARIRGMKR